MAKTKELSLNFKAFAYLSLLTIIFILEIIILPADKISLSYYGVSAVNYRIIEILTNLTLILVWVIAFWGYLKLYNYAKALNNIPEAKVYKQLAFGIAWLAWSLPLIDIVNKLLLTMALKSHLANSITTIVNNYFVLVMPLVAFLIIGIAVKKLNILSKPTNNFANYLAMLIFLIAGSIYAYLIVEHLRFHNLTAFNNIYHLPVWLVIVSIIIPYLYGWFVGLLSSFELTRFGLNSAGIIYKKALLYLTTGLSGIIISFILLQYLTTIWPATPHIEYNYRLIIIILCRIFSGLSFLIMSIGASKLTTIEKV